MKKRLIWLLAAMVLLCGCGASSSGEEIGTVPSEQETLPPIRVMETIGMYDEYPGLERRDMPPQEIWYAPVFEDGQLQLRCLVRNDTDLNLEMQELEVIFYRNGEQISREIYGSALIQRFMRPADSAMELTPGDTTLLKVTDGELQEVFQEAFCRVTLSDGIHEARIQEFRFTKNEEKVTVPTLVWEGGWSPVAQGEQSWVFYAQLENNTDAPLYLEAMHVVFYKDGLPVNTNSFSASQLAGMHTSHMAELSPGESYTYSDGHPLNNAWFDQKEVTFLYRYAQGQCVTMVYRFRLDPEEALREASEEEGVSVLYDLNRLPDALGRAEYSSRELRDMIVENLSLEEVAQAIRTVPDLLLYFHESRYGLANGDLSFTDGGVEWHLNASPHSSFYGNRGNTGGSCNLINYILRGDYEEQGYYVEVTTLGAHIQSYVRQDGVYYFLDVTDSMRNEIYDITLFRMTEAEDPVAYARLRREQNHALYTPDHNFYTVLQYLYPWEGSHRPLGLQDTFTLLPEELKGAVVLLHQEPGFAPEFATTPSEALWPPLAQ